VVEAPEVVRSDAAFLAKLLVDTGEDRFMADRLEIDDGIPALPEAGESAVKIAVKEMRRSRREETGADRIAGTNGPHDAPPEHTLGEVDNALSTGTGLRPSADDSLCGNGFVD